MAGQLWRFRATLVALGAATAFAAAIASPAVAGTGVDDGTTLTYTALPGEQNNIVVSRSGGSGTPWLIDDSGATVVAGVGCTAASTTELSCPDPANTVSSVVVNAGDGNDTIRNATNLTSFLNGGDGNDTLSGAGGNDAFDGGAGTNTVDYSDAASGVTVDLGAGTATNDGDGGTDTLTNIQNVTGSALGDTIVGDSGPNALRGGGGADTIAGAGGDDVLDGGTGTDTVSYSPIGGTSYAGSPNPVVVNLAAGTASGEGNDTLSNFEIVVGSPLDDTLIPANGGSTLNGGAGNDRLVNGPGDDTFDGGAGTDTVDYSGASSPITVDLSNPAPQATGAGSDTFVPNSVENLMGSPQNDNLSGDANANVLSGGGGNDVLAGRGGNDTLDGGAGTNTASYAGAAAGANVNLRAGVAVADGDGSADTLVNIQNVTGSPNDDVIEGDGGNNVLNGGGGNDTVAYTGASAGVYVDLGAGTSTGDGFDTLSGFENVIGSNFADTLLGDGSNNVLNGGAGDDQLSGGAGDDVLNGGDGNDTLSGGGGFDTLNGGNGNDTLSGGTGFNTLDGGTGTNTLDYSGASVAVTVDLGAGTGVGDGVDSVANVQNVIGSSFADTISGDASDNVLNGGGGDDWLNGRGGDDTLVGGTGSDTASFAGGAAVDANLATGVATGQGTDSLSGIENLTGSDNADVLTGDATNNVLNGGAGNDTLDGGAGNDALIGGGGTDTADYSNSPFGVTVNLAAGTASGYGNDTLTGIANVIGSSFDDSITGDAGANVLSGGNGNDVIVGGPGSDTVSGGLGNDTIDVKDGFSDTVSCGPGTDSVTADSIDTVAADCETPPPAAQAPVATTGTASTKGANTTLSGTVNPNGSATTYFFQWGTTTAYGSSSAPASAGSGTTNVPVSTTIKGLKAKTTYHFRLVASSPAGTSFGTDATFTTAK